MPEIPKFQHWPDRSDELQPAEVVQLYEKGFAGVEPSPEQDAALLDDIRGHGGYTSAADAAHDNVWAGSGAGKLVFPCYFILQQFPGCLPGPAQTRGDCVSHSAKNSALQTLVSEIVASKPDEVTGVVEGKPEVPPDGISQGVLSTEAIYWWRRHGGDGWSCSHAARVLVNESGMWLRKNYDQFGVDLTRYSGRTAGKWGRTPPPSEMKKFGNEHLIRTATVAKSFEEIRDLLHNGYGISSCGSEGFSNSRNEDGVSSRRGSWAHAMAYLGADDRDETKQKYGGPLVLVQNSWGNWNTGPRKIRGTDLEIPGGAFWAKWSDLRRRYAVAMSSADGWPPRMLPDYGGSLLG